MRKMVGLCWALVLLPFCCFAQTASSPIAPVSPQKLQSIGGFLEVCGREWTKVSKVRMEAMRKAPLGEVSDTFEKVLAAGIADQFVCSGYLTGLYEGWKEGHEHGVLAAKFPAGVPRDLSTALKSLSDEELESTLAAFDNDVPCIPDHITSGELREVVVKYLRREVEGKILFFEILLTSRMFPEALREAYPCPVAKPATPK